MTSKVDTPPTSLDEIRRLGNRATFPQNLLSYCDSALMLFCAGFYGANDCIWVQHHGIRRVRGIDVDDDKLRVMRKLYPPNWWFSHADVFESIPSMLKKYDLVVADPSINLVQRLLKRVRCLTDLSEKFVVVTIQGTVEYDWTLPSDWYIRGYHLRNQAGTCWMILERR